MFVFILGEIVYIILGGGLFVYPRMGAGKARVYKSLIIIPSSIYITLYNIQGFF